MSNTDKTPSPGTPPTSPNDEKPAPTPKSPYPQEDVEDRDNVSTVRPEDYPEQQ